MRGVLNVVKQWPRGKDMWRLVTTWRWSCRCRNVLARAILSPLSLANSVGRMSGCVSLIRLSMEAIWVQRLDSRLWEMSSFLARLSKVFDSLGALDLEMAVPRSWCRWWNEDWATRDHAWQRGEDSARHRSCCRDKLSQRERIDCERKDCPCAQSSRPIFDWRLRFSSVMLNTEERAFRVRTCWENQVCPAKHKKRCLVLHRILALCLFLMQFAHSFPFSEPCCPENFCLWDGGNQAFDLLFCVVVHVEYRRTSPERWNALKKKKTYLPSLTHVKYLMVHHVFDATASYSNDLNNCRRLRR